MNTKLRFNRRGNDRNDGVDEGKDVSQMNVDADSEMRDLYETGHED